MLFIGEECVQTVLLKPHDISKYQSMYECMKMVVVVIVIMLCFFLSSNSSVIPMEKALLNELHTQYYHTGVAAADEDNEYSGKC